MKTKLFSTIILFFLFVNLCTAQKGKSVTSKKVVFNVEMDCISCKKKIEKNIAFEKGVKLITTNLKNQTVEITYDTIKTNIQNIQLSLKKIGYEATLIPISACVCNKCSCENCKSNCKS